MNQVQVLENGMYADALKLCVNLIGRISIYNIYYVNVTECAGRVL